MEVNPWHSTKSDVHHYEMSCNTGNNIEPENRQPRQASSLDPGDPATHSKCHHLRSGVSSVVLWAVCCAWPDGRHEFVRLGRRLAGAAGRLVVDPRGWLPDPMGPWLSIVELRSHEFGLHGRQGRLGRGMDCVRATTTALGEALCIP